MTLILLEGVSAGLRGQLSRWLMELHPGVFLGTVSALVRDQIWEICQNRRGKGACMLIHPAQNEQGFRIYTAGRCSREIVDQEGLQLVRATLKDPFQAL